ncbi:DUF2312 domain-containing protein [Ehrlichia canis]|uniref:Uncharacterized protein n=1 Tax=Ehrlichia canis (strain Jake) TaxID=269484 RepID=A0ACA6AWV0_EHRCJ|nr:DUF2312 domain-containing protein [Ehrlichia canis]AAZ68499.1 conserved hypothetical protein [Ehrlichia canis str. Jake]AUO54755.1 DUF2312 domain-containing protein [Ehrlichia canis]UKC53829.1 DUF2312 domain-containing protein [Ehrlichia canis]UKC54765.1 DUF2312 domain-containing protein [Ehrlichia canis]UKC55701.1 DUF2312 domain-containing protein [Ehrlichia canis]
MNISNLTSQNENNVVIENLKRYIERIEKLESEREEISQYIRKVYNEANSNGFNSKVMRQIVKLRKMDNDDREEHEMLLMTYKRALGILVEVDE